MLVWVFLSVAACATTDQPFDRSQRDNIGQNRLRNNLSLFKKRLRYQRMKEEESIESQIARRLIKPYNGKTDVEEAKLFLKTMSTARRSHANRRQNRRREAFMSRMGYRRNLK